MDDIAIADAFARRALAGDGGFHLLPDLADVDFRAVVADLGPVTRQVRGRKMRTMETLADEFAAAWQFADFGPGVPDLDEGLSDLYLTWPSALGFAVIVLEAEQVLAEKGELSFAVETFGFIREKLGVAVAGSAPSARPALAFDIFLVTDAEHRDEVVRLWTAAGAPLEP